ncbi:hypothetical protein D1007_61295 [Hordeum vulgare]|uniref:Uncharacterized protein n=2 Tax=Hordeum vulgare subsp. vulgare TaxID=112509 RepID=A0A8I7B645_HORVV|nr:uncharacterized protein LOC123444892 isoform X2 [Hordeum vulgare subsp. vulgare]KAE8767371.1 hypothetical protein D1007_61295 [Hordeum vulgare]KAI5003793.1 hypothetical protein ZWY2020_030953 [Hordeum vulgare]KAI5007629.1 hypothetical protein ZWY2020_058099 [Hordeum vulgare]
MEPKRSSPQPRAATTKKSPPRAAAADAAGADSPLSSLFHPASHGVNGKEQDLYAILFKGQNGNAQASMTDGQSQWSPAKSRTTYTKDNKYDSVGTSSCFGSSVHYGGRDYYGSSAPKQAAEYSDYKVDKKDPVADSHGDWWQGSFYY